MVDFCRAVIISRIDIGAAKSLGHRRIPVINKHAVPDRAVRSAVLIKKENMVAVLQALYKSIPALPRLPEISLNIHKSIFIPVGSKVNNFLVAPVFLKKGLIAPGCKTVHCHRRNKPRFNIILIKISAFLRVKNLRHQIEFKNIIHRARRAKSIVLPVSKFAD